MASYLLTLFTALALALGARADITNNPELVAKLRAAGTQVDRMNLIPNDADWVFNFNEQAGFTYDPASVINANTASWPTVVGHKLTMATIQLGPCGMLPPHYHPRASNYVISVQGETETYMIEENGARMVKTTLTPGKLTIFPQGSIHTMMNPRCENAQLVSALSDEDSGTSNILTGLFQLPADFIVAAFGSNPSVDVNDTASDIPPVAYGGMPGTMECRQRCGLKI